MDKAQRTEININNDLDNRQRDLTYRDTEITKYELIVKELKKSESNYMKEVDTMKLRIARFESDLEKARTESNGSNS